MTDNVSEVTITTKIQKVGASHGVIIPKVQMDILGISNGDVVTVIVKKE